MKSEASRIKFAAALHEHVPENWYFKSIKENIFQRYWHTKRFAEVAKTIQPVKGKILDIGSADGIFSKVIMDKSHAKSLVGIDVLPKSIEWANRHWQGSLTAGRQGSMKFVLGDAHKLKFNVSTFDAVFALEVLEHVIYPLAVLKEIKRVLKKGGYAVFLVPSDSLLFKVIWFLWTRFKGKIWKEAHIQSYKNDYLLNLSESAGFKIEVSKKFILGMLHLVKVRKS